MLPVLGVIYAIDAVKAVVDERKQKRRLKRDWRYRIHNTGRTMASLKNWQIDIDAYDKHVRKILAIAELNDLPIDVWKDLDHIREAPCFYDMAQMFGTELYTDEVKSTAVRGAISHYTGLSRRSNETREEAERRVADVIMRHTDASEVSAQCSPEPLIVAGVRKHPYGTRIELGYTRIHADTRG